MSSDFSDFLTRALQRSRKNYGVGPGNDPLVLPPSAIPGGENADTKGQMKPEGLMNNKVRPGDILNDKGEFDKDQTPFDIQKYLHGGEQGTLRNFLDRIMSPSPTASTPGLQGGQATVSDLSPTAAPVQRGQDLTALPPEPVPLPVPRPDYSMPTALDPNSIEELRRSLLTDAGQMDPNNPNGLSGRMNAGDASFQMNDQRKETMGIEDSIRGFDGGPKPHDMSGVTSGPGASETVGSALPDLSSFLSAL